MNKVRVLLFIILIGFVIVALPDSDIRLFSISKEHGPSLQDAIGLILILFSYIWLVIEAWKQKEKVLKYQDSTVFKMGLFLFGVGHGLIIASVIIAKKDNSISWFDTSSNNEKGVSGQDTEEFLEKIDCYVMGSRTYEHALELSKSYGWAYGDKPTIVVTSRNLPIERQHIEFYSGDLNKLVSERLKPNYRNVWLVGGAMLAREFIRLKLTDEIRVNRISHNIAVLR